MYSTFLGGSGFDRGLGIAVDASGNAYVTGNTFSTDFPTSSPFQSTSGGSGDTFVTKLNPTGSTLVYSTYLGGSGNDNGRGIAVDSSGNAYVAGNVNSTDFPTASPFQAALGGTSGNDAFVTKFNPAGSALIYSTYLGGSLNDVGIKIATDTSGNASVIGFTRSTDFPTANAFQASFAGTDDAFVTKLNPTGSALVFSTYLGGIGDEEGDNIAVDGSGNVYVSGSTTSTDFPTANPFQAANAGSDDAFVTKFSATGSAVYSTYLGGSGFECAAFGLAVDASGNAYAAGCTLSTDFPTVDPIQASNAGGGGDVFVTKLNAAGSALVYSTYLGGTGFDGASDVAVDAAGNAYVVGDTFSTDFPTVNPFMDYIGGTGDAFVFKIGQALTPPPPPPPCTYSISPTSASFPASGGTGSVLISTRCGWNAKSDVSWITITSGTSGGGTNRVEYEVAANPDPGSRLGTLTLSGEQILTVTQAGTAPAGTLTVTPLELSFSGLVGAAAASRTLQVSSDGGPVNWTAAVTLLNGDDWLTISPTEGIAPFDLPVPVAVEVNFAALGAAGLFQAVITVTDPESEASFEIPVAVALRAPGGRLLIDPSAIVFTAASTATGSLSQTLRVINLGEGSLQWSISLTSGSLPSWLEISPNAGTAGPGAPQASTTILSADPTGLGSGVNQVLLEVSAPGASSSPQLLAVTLHVVPAATPGRGDLTPQAFLFLAEPSGALPAEQELTLSNGGGGSLTAEYAVSIESGGDWLMVSPSSGTASGDGPFPAQVSVNQAGLSAGVYQGTITATFSSGPPQEVEVLLIVASQAGVLRTQAAGLPRAAQCAPSGLQLLATTIGNGLSLPVSFPRVLTALVVDDCGSAVDNATLVTSVEGLNIPLRSLGTGFYSGTWVPRSEAASVTLTFDALHPTFAQVQRSFTVSTAAAPGAVSLPSLFADGVVEGAGFTPLRPLSAGGIISLFGARFADGNNFASQLPLERELGGVSVRVGGQDTPLFFVGPGQINAQMPFEVSPGDSVPVAVSVGGLLTAPQNYLIAPVQPGIFDLGGGQGAVSIANTLILVAPVGSIPGRLSDSRQVNPERRALPRLAVDPHVAAALLDNPVDGGQTQPGAFAFFLGREERLEQVGLGLGVHPAAGVAYPQHDVSARLDGHVGAGIVLVQLHVSRLDRELAALRHRVASVDCQIQDDLFDLPGVGFDLTQPRPANANQLNILSDQPLGHLVHVGHHLVEVEQLGLQHLPAAEG